ncbi:uncharacterized protein LOC110019585 isoform X2 [Phalaenopsis equestris]|uniref:uncharacterized protein LOC110019585 isoform X2 n=1 Tax=Phalaenopsis equestris TaxID=78828 RepID=UPI0009E2BCBE|nr:uncharacterized protein LOC110019585 isoform X2 [Phalaenopsis equestris]
MDSGGNDAKMCNGNDSSSVGVSNGGADKAEEKEVETSSLLCSALKKGGMKGRRQRSRRKKVQWNDCNGNKLVEIMEFQPSDSSDSEDEYRSTDSIWCDALAGCMLICCCIQTQR